MCTIIHVKYRAKSCKYDFAIVNSLYYDLNNQRIMRTYQKVNGTKHLSTAVPIYSI